jgi:hypothetical protein
MAGRWVAALGAAAVALVCAGAAAPSDRAERAGCELVRADRARTRSTSCIACHDGTAGHATVATSTSGALGSHPVGVSYGLALARRPSEYASPGQLPPDVPLVAGRVECTSCHDGASRLPKHVAHGPDLCETCHHK